MSLERESWQALQSAARLYQSMWQLQLKDLGMQDRQAQTLLFIGKEPKTIGELAEVFNCVASNITGVIERLEQTNWVERFECQTDKRKVYVRLTKKGLQKYQEVYNRWHFIPKEWMEMDKEFHENMKKLTNTVPKQIPIPDQDVEIC